MDKEKVRDKTYFPHASGFNTFILDKDWKKVYKWTMRAVLCCLLALLIKNVVYEDVGILAVFVALFLFLIGDTVFYFKWKRAHRPGEKV